ncbi:hypothetical protein ElyMa_001675100 [Elysia marginata]|uniref:Uncharacterized protein n=1 Tax=Elysia marginata TaxID=1093978 RepID=A0AAV4JRC8_9GAST|nr:hypothetical protein ElyMa_001675100 [Elysia marginata]
MPSNPVLVKRFKLNDNNIEITKELVVHNTEHAPSRNSVQQSDSIMRRVTRYRCTTDMSCDQGLIANLLASMIHVLQGTVLKLPLPLKIESVVGSSSLRRKPP